jgi:hypothetical protein
MPLSTIFQLYHDMSVLLVEETGVSRENYQTAVTGLEVFGKHQKLARVTLEVLLIVKERSEE